MRCLLCENISYYHICKSCQKEFLEAGFYKTEIKQGFFVYSFFKYEQVKELINTKYQFFGDAIFNILAKLSFKKFAQNFVYEKIYAIALDDHTRHDFSHTAILAKALKSKNITPLYNTLQATNIVKYAGKDLKYRQTHKRKFKYKGKEGLKVILVDDIVTTANTILEAKSVLEKHNCKVLFALSLTQAKNQ
jgi:competence protein ComFC